MNSIMMLKLSFSAIVLAALVTGCASVPMATRTDDAKIKLFPKPDDGNAGIYIYRNSSLGSALKKDLWIDGECLGESVPKVYFYRQVEGNQSHIISTESEFSPNDLVLQTDVGKNYYIRQYIKWGIFVGGANLEQVSEAEGQSEISKLQLAERGICSN